MIKNKKIFINIDYKEFILKKELIKVFNIIKKQTIKKKSPNIILSVTENFLFFLKDKYNGKKITFALKNSFFEKQEYIFNTSLETLKDFKIDYCFVYNNRDKKLYNFLDIKTNLKVKKALEKKINPVLIIGEETRDDSGNFADQLETEIKYILKDIEKKYLSKITLIYRPLWLDTKNKFITKDILNQSLFLIKRILYKIYQEESKKIDILFYADIEDQKINENLKELKYNGVYINFNNKNSSLIF